MSSEKFCLKWNDFESNISVAFRDLRDDGELFDVSLACCDESTGDSQKFIQVKDFFSRPGREVDFVLLFILLMELLFSMIILFRRTR